MNISNSNDSQKFHQFSFSFSFGCGLVSDGGGCKNKQVVTIFGLAILISMTFF
jgi:hypothetical protein